MRFRWVSVLLLLSVLGPLIAGGCANNSDSSTTQSPSSDNTTLFLAGDGELWSVDVATETASHVKMPQLSPGDPPYRILARGSRFVTLWGYSTYVLGPADSEEGPRKLVGGSLFFIPSDVPNRVWVAIKGPGGRGRLDAVREVSMDGRVTVPDVKPPGGRWPQFALASGLAFAIDKGIKIWDPETRKVVSRLSLKELGGENIGPAFGDILVACRGNCRTLHLTNVATEAKQTIAAPDGYGFENGYTSGAFSPDGKQLAVALVPLMHQPSADRQLGLVDIAEGQVQLAPGSSVAPYYVFVTWSPAGDQVFVTGGERFKPRTIVTYSLGSDQAHALDVNVGDFYGIAAVSRPGRG